MSVDTPARIAIIGAGPLGLEAALYARYLGYEVLVFEQHAICHSLLQQRAEVLPLRARDHRTSLGLSALRAQSDSFSLPDPNALETAHTLAESYFIPLAGTDLLSGCVRPGHAVLRIERTEFSEEEIADQKPDENVQADSGEDGEYEEVEELEYAPFELLLRLPDGSESTERAEVVIDASGISQATPINFESLRIQPESPLNTPIEQSPEANADIQTLEPNFYRLGSKSCAPERFTISAGHDQIRRLFAIVGGRDSLNLYETFRPR